MMKKRALCLLSAATLSLCMLQTGFADEATNYSTDALHVAIWDNAQLDGLQQIADKWTEQSGVKVNIDVITWGEYWTLLEAGAMGGEMPDVFWMHINEAEKYTSNGILLNLDDYIAADDAIDLGNYYEGIVELYSYDGSQYALPKDHDSMALLYNKAIFDKYGVEYPKDEWTWDDFADAAATITEAGAEDGVYGTAVNVDDGQNCWYSIVFDYGGNLISEDKKTSMMDDENTIAAFEWIGDRLIPIMPSQSIMAETGNQSLFLSGLIAMTFQGSWMVNTFYQAENSADYAWAQLPYYDKNGNGTCEKEERCFSYNGLGWAASANTEDPQAAYDLISWFCSKEGQTMQSELGVTLAGYIGCSEPFIEAFEGMDLTAFTDIEEDGTPVMHPNSKSTANWDNAINVGLIPAWNDPSTMEDVCRSIAQTMNEILANE